MSEQILDISAIDLTIDSAKRYGSAVVFDRALPDVRDGLKPVHRRIMLGLNDMKLTSKGRYKKLAAVSGHVMAFYHPHGDSSINDATVRLSQSWVMRCPLVDTEGNNGSLDGDPAASARYLEVGGSDIVPLLFNKLQSSGIAMHSNYDNTVQVPEVLPVEFPMLYVNGSVGIAFGYSCNFPSHNPIELLDASIYLNEHPNCSLSDLMRFVKGPDFPTGGYVANSEGLMSVYKTGMGSFELRGSVTFEGSKIVITEIPYGLSKIKLLKSIESALVATKLDTRVKSLVDESEGYGVRLVIDCQRGSDLQSIVEVLYKRSNLSTMFHAQCIALVDGRPEMLSLQRYLSLFLDFRRNVLYHQLKDDYRVLYDRAHILEGLLRLYGISKEVVEMIRSANGKADVVEKLQSMFQFTLAQAESIAMMRLYRISNQDYGLLEKEYHQVVGRMKELIQLLQDKDAFRSYLTSELERVKEHFVSFERSTKIVDKFESYEVDLTEVVVASKASVVVRPTGVQRMTRAVFDNNIDEFKSDVVFSGHTLTSSGLLLFSKEGRVVQRLVDDVEQTSIRQQPDDLHKTVKQLSSSDEFIGACLFELNEVDQYVVLSLTHQGLVKLSKLSDLLMSYSTKGYLNRSKVYNGLKTDGDFVDKVFVLKLDDLIYFELFAKSGRRSKHALLSELTIQGASGSGSRFVKVKENEPVVYELVNLTKDLNAETEFDVKEEDDDIDDTLEEQVEYVPLFEMADD